MQPVPEDFWWNVARQCEYATFYHTPLWRDIALQANPQAHRDETFAVVLPSGVRVVFPMISTRQLGSFRWLQATFENCYGGFIADGPVEPHEATAIYQHIFDWSTYTFYNIDNPLGPALPEEIQAQCSDVYNEPTYLVELDADFETVFGRFQRTQRKDYRRGLRNGVAVRLAQSLEEYRIYYGIYQDALDRWSEGTLASYEWHLFELFYQFSQNYPEEIKLWVFTLEEQIVGGTLIFYWGAVASAWNGTAHRDFLSYDVMPVGDTEIIRDAIKRGYRYFDFNTSGNKEGVQTYKLRFAPTTKPIHMWRFESPLLQPMQQIYWKATGKR
ncbi:hypothetical protein A9Q02_03010 [Candidatus Chloroploca asiatica]|uniref:BioF2-like acetyltransferase domain-containing protein n=2 Tax=Candidatus Chloroploca asiatica TaxID=1506545 RepID=A0A2H3KS47_9CHLR|nr:hypothetical protein A9Q02_03010 [Candidatus Chloroploca asiatica]